MHGDKNRSQRPLRRPGADGKAHAVACQQVIAAKMGAARDLAAFLHRGRAGAEEGDQPEARDKADNRVHSPLSASSTRTRARSSGSTSASNHGLRFIQPTTRQLGCGSGMTRGAYSEYAATV